MRKGEEDMSTVKKAIIALMIFIGALFISNQVDATTISTRSLGNYNNVKVNRISYGDRDMFCSQKGGTIGNHNYTLEDRSTEDLAKYQQYAYIFSFFTKSGDSYNVKCNDCKISTTNEINIKGLCDKHYAYLQAIIWSSPLTDTTYVSRITITSPAELRAYITEAEYYNMYYSSLRRDSNGDAIYSVTGNDKSAKVYVNQDKGTYTVGSFTLNYEYKAITETVISGSVISGSVISGEYLMLAGIEDIIVYDQDGNKVKNVTIVDKNGKAFSNDSGNYKFPTKGEEFYVTFPSSGNPNVTAVTLDVQFKYLNKCKRNIYY